MPKPIAAVTPSGEPMVVLTRADYEALLRDTGRAPHMDNISTVRVSKAALDRLTKKDRDSEYIPFDEANALLARFAAGESPIRVFRTTYGLTQAELAERAGINRLYLSKLERGNATGSLKTLAQIAKALGMDTGDLIAILERPSVRKSRR